MKTLQEKIGKEGYIPENAEEGDNPYYYEDFLRIARGNEKLAEVIYDLCEWQHPETIFEELLIEEEIDEDGNMIYKEEEEE